jgi:hypothetical protein
MKPDTWTDPIVEEVRKIREEHAGRFDFDLARIFEDLKRNERESEREVVSFAEGTKPLPLSDRR